MILSLIFKTNIDFLNGLKENVIVGRLIPAGTGFYMNKVRKIANERDKNELKVQVAAKSEITFNKIKAGPRGSLSPLSQ